MFREILKACQTEVRGTNQGHGGFSCCFIVAPRRTNGPVACKQDILPSFFADDWLQTGTSQKRGMKFNLMKMSRLSPQHYRFEKPVA